MPDSNDVFDKEESGVDPFDSLLQEEINSPIGATATTGPMIPPSFHPTKIPEASADNMVCLRGPCEYYFEAVKRFPHGNTEGTFGPGEEPKRISRWCTAFKGEPLDLTDEVVHDCNHWVPMDNLRKVSIEARRKAWLEENGEE